MKKRGSVILLVLCLCISMVLAGCGKSKTASKEKDVYTVKIGYENQPGEPLDLAAQEWKRLAEEKSKGKIKVELYPSSQLGSKQDVIEQMKTGANIIHIADASFLMDYVPDIGVLSAPYLTDSYEDLFKVTDSDWFKGLEKDLQKEGIHIVTTKWIYGDRQLITTKPVKEPKDLKGLKVRVPSNPLAIKIMEKMGATATPLPLGEVYPSIAQGVIDGMENPLPVILGSKVYEKAKFLSLTAHTNMIIQWIAGQSYMESLPDDVAKVLKETGDESGKFMEKKVKESEVSVLKDLKDAGVEIVEPDKAAFKEATKAVYKEMDEWSPGLYDKIQKIIKE
ncbi:C4-dicarboxylate TRAP transporter substrate-binding protein [Bacillus sp. ISL-40]|uniref:C4-dicarboxylate TRAP transporter substrate-binding protein n=1 Tax=unclassified Bacillus (in: firmicutes) TaxID=185979 RepID=UPI001BE85073|nr:MULTISPECIES: C4-dicarboxylate TRAP transporter substrate-binding protein [unclassified Bacillus (in: firmicutes)]MBT2699961.1 C4-dicarboxylate TRAP transporter substrate-binding protein [Bacillus sp. ISL-40]MBT2722979.1 C4-dicarboxylate TRAP transporter substrate-binding protein [Bacillus sp. ISL-46]MBT2740842.1 C4-dicarboxylate TRAP transporter substrate-binding protein [Bacillus sp. ISL-77]